MSLEHTGDKCQLSEPLIQMLPLIIHLLKVYRLLGNVQPDVVA